MFSQLNGRIVFQAEGETFDSPVGKIRETIVVTETPLSYRQTFPDQKRFFCYLPHTYDDGSIDANRAHAFDEWSDVREWLVACGIEAPPLAPCD